METQLDQNAVDVTVTCQGRCGITFVDDIYFLEDVFNVFNRSKNQYHLGSAEDLRGHAVHKKKLERQLK